eukprot:GFUD01006132.1.p1 GENE.GFUD01006132.1~~GFUD01006132.1.p1  ORF type:complete len:823 (-),score=279.43 GFUD01006132.1:129-2597(-)
MSRLIVKNLPFSISEAKLRSTFSPHGSITDLQLKYKKDGKFRGFGFVGFLTEEGASKAKDWLDGTFIGAAKIKVEMCKELGQQVGKEKVVIVEEEKKKVELKTGAEKYKEDPKFQEFMSVHTRDATGGTWGNDSGSVVGVDAKNEVAEEEEDVDEEEKSDESKDNNNSEPVSDLDYLKSKKTPKAPPKPPVDLFTVKITGLPYKSKKKDIKTLLAPLKPVSVRLPPKIKGIAFAGFTTEKEMKTALNKHKSFCGEHQIQVFKHTARSKIVEAAEPASKWSEQEAALEGVETVGESGRIFVRNLPYTATEEDISDLFSKFGPLTETTVPVDRLTRKYKGFAFVTFMMPEHAVAAFSALDGSSLMGRLLHLIPAKTKLEENDVTGGGTGSDSFKKAKEAKQKASAGSSHNWNSLFLGTSAVADVMAAQYGVDKARVVMDQEGKEGKTSAAVKLALGETEIVGQTRSFLEQEGVQLDVFNRKPDKRSKTVILAKNLPARTSPEELRDMFTKFGVVDRLVLPLHCLTAIIEFADPGEARAAFTKLAYSRFHNAPLYLEWAPENTFNKPFVKEAIIEEGVEEKEEIKKVSDTVEDDDDTEPEEGSTLFVKNLNFSTTDEELKEHFVSCGSIQSGSVATKNDTKSGESLSMGFGFVTFYLKSSAEKALKTLQQSMLAEHCLELKRSTRASTNQTKSKTEKEKKSLGKPSTKLLVRNIPFQANKQEITQIFKTFGELSAVRLPTKLAGTGDHRGFAFIEYSSVSDAKAAFSSLVHSTHLYGRRLVLEWAQGETTLEELRDKTKQHWGDGRVGQEKRARFEMGNTTESAD